MDPNRIPTLSAEDVSFFKKQYTIELSHEQLHTYVHMLLNGLVIQFEYPKVVVIPQMCTVPKVLPPGQRCSKNLLPLGEMVFASKHGMYKLPLDGKYHHYNYLMEKFTGLYSVADACELASIIHQLGKTWQEIINPSK
jgi:hypothetical protein